MATQALITHGDLADINFPADEANMIVHSSNITASKIKSEYKGADAKGGIVAVQYRTPTLSISIDSYLTSLAGLAVQEIGTEIDSLANLSDFGGLLAGVSLSASLMTFEDPVFNGSLDDAIKFSFKSTIYPDITPA